MLNKNSKYPTENVYKETKTIIFLYISRVIIVKIFLKKLY